MKGLFILGIFCILWGVAALIIAITKPNKLWNLGKIQGFVKLMGNSGTTVMISVLGIVMFIVGIILVI